MRRIKLVLAVVSAMAVLLVVGSPAGACQNNLVPG
jgi:hypothetical protein